MRATSTSEVKTRKNAPPNFDELRSAIEKSRQMLGWEDDWDGEGSPGYAEATWKRATDFVMQNTLQLWRNYGFYADIPRVTPGPDGSVDILWRSDKRKLLLNVPTDVKELASYYGENSDHETIEGTLDISLTNDWLLMWLMKVEHRG